MTHPSRNQSAADRAAARADRNRKNRLRRQRRKAARAARKSKRVLDFLIARDNIRRRMWQAYREGRPFPYSKTLGLRVRTIESPPVPTSRVYLGRYSWFAPSFSNGADVFGNQLSAGLSITTKYCMDELHFGPPYRQGGPLRIFNIERPTDLIFNQGTYYSVTGAYKYEGGFLLNRFSLPVNWDLAFTDQEVSYESYGATGWNRAKPGRPGVDLGVALGEIQEMPRMLATTAFGLRNLSQSLASKRNRFGGSRELSNQYVNTQFGWVPFLSDFRGFIKTWEKSDELYKKLIEQNNQWQRRRRTIKDETEDEVIAESATQTAHSLAPSSYFYTNPLETGSYKITRRKIQRIWFVGSFKYYIPDIGSVSWKRSARAKMYGLSVTPDLVWNLTPWSWLADWVSNAGDVFSNMSSNLAENLVAQYAYIMGTTEYVYYVESTHKLCGGPVYANTIFRAEHKIREYASPFGFGIHPDAFTPRQVSILGAIGLSKGAH